MREYKFLPVILIVLIIMMCSCSTKEDKSSTVIPSIVYTPLNVQFFDNLDQYELADKISGIVNAGTITLDNEYPHYSHERKLIRTQYEYVTSNGGSIRIWTSDQMKPYRAQYHFRYDGTSETHEFADAHIVIESVISKLGIVLDGSDELVINQQTGRLPIPECEYCTWYDFSLYQTFEGEQISNHFLTEWSEPYMTGDMQGDTGRINNVTITAPWCTNLSEIQESLSDITLKELAYEYYKDLDLKSDPKRPDDIPLQGYYIVENKLCRLAHGQNIALTDKYGSFINLFIDIQSGEIVNSYSIAVD